MQLLQSNQLQASKSFMEKNLRTNRAGSKIARRKSWAHNSLDDGALPYVITARVKAAIRLAQEGNDER
jgi:citrate lyase gamma subunit